MPSSTGCDPSALAIFSLRLPIVWLCLLMPGNHRGRAEQGSHCRRCGHQSCSGRQQECAPRGAPRTCVWAAVFSRRGWKTNRNPQQQHSHMFPTVAPVARAKSKVETRGRRLIPRIPRNWHARGHNKLQGVGQGPSWGGFSSRAPLGIPLRRRMETEGIFPPLNRGGGSKRHHEWSFRRECALCMCWATSGVRGLAWGPLDRLLVDRLVGLGKLPDLLLTGILGLGAGAGDVGVGHVLLRSRTGHLGRTGAATEAEHGRVHTTHGSSSRISVDGEAENEHSDGRDRKRAVPEGRRRRSVSRPGHVDFPSGGCHKDGRNRFRDRKMYHAD